MRPRSDPAAEPETDAEAIRQYEDAHGEDTYSPELGKIWICECGCPRSFADVEDDCCDVYAYDREASR